MTQRRHLPFWPIFLLLLSPALAQPGPSEAPDVYRQKIRRFYPAEEFIRSTQGRVEIERRVNRGGPNEPGEAEEAPLSNAGGRCRVTVRARAGSALWLGTSCGALRATAPDQRTLEYFAGQRWLPDDQVSGIGFEQNGEVIWIETPKGYSRIEYRPMTLAEKARAFEERIRARHVRHGLTASSRLRVPGDLSGNRTISDDNDGLWTAIYVAAECFRYRVTGAPEAREYARQGMQAIMRLEEITGLPGFPARSFIEIGRDDQPDDGEWHTTPDGRWRWKGDTSSDEITGHYFVYPIYYDLVADESEKRQLRAVLTRITSHIVDHQYQLIDLDGQRTAWGWWRPDLVLDDPDETGLRALQILSHLRVAIHVTGEAKFQAAYDELIDKHRYHLLTRNQKINIPTKTNHSDDELAFLSYYPLLLYEKDPRLREVYLQSLQRSWLIERPERNPLWNFIYAAGTGAREYDREDSIRTLREIPMDLISWTVRNSRRPDLDPRLIESRPDRFGNRQSLIVLPYDELPIMKWNGNPYRLDGGDDGRTEDDGAFFLLPYWMGRYHRLIGE
ncbi:MAG TPA: hypothetical protein VJ302_12230 [Blastocatellia bacterium]|nr:hypothetical protein [Blastocatellia bacterium]